jgi:glycosyltransferase involved in cell wall biosynthesis
MEIVFFLHPGFLDSQSMPRFARMLAEGMKERGHSVSLWEPKPLFHKLPFNKSLRKWLGYIDQFIVFPREVKRRVKKGKENAIYVFTDHALGPWVPLVANYPHVIHCHDFLAQYSALGKIPENKISWTGKQYQRYIRKGYSKGKNFISVSEKTRDDLHRFLGKIPNYSEMVYNGLNQSFINSDVKIAGEMLSNKTGIDLTGRFILHVGGNQWYKNRLGVLEIYNAWRTGSQLKLPLLLIGEQPSEALWGYYQKSPFQSDIHFISGLKDEYVRLAYASAALLLFPSLAEGFGWPIAEAMISGCPVITTNEAPMTEVAGNAGFYINRRPCNSAQVVRWAEGSAKVVEQVVALSAEDRTYEVEKGLLNVQRFGTTNALNQIEKIYDRIIQSYK